jgi:hypothetical protein
VPSCTLYFLVVLQSDNCFRRKNWWLHHIRLRRSNFSGKLLDLIENYSTVVAIKFFSRKVLLENVEDFRTFSDAVVSHFMFALYIHLLPVFPLLWIGLNSAELSWVTSSRLTRPPLSPLLALTEGASPARTDGAFFSLPLFGLQVFNPSTIISPLPDFQRCSASFSALTLLKVLGFSFFFLSKTFPSHSGGDVKLGRKSVCLYSFSLLSFTALNFISTQVWGKNLWMVVRIGRRHFHSLHVRF